MAVEAQKCYLKSWRKSSDLCPKTLQSPDCSTRSNTSLLCLKLSIELLEFFRVTA